VIDLEFIKINENWNAEPNAPMPTIEVIGSNLILSFYLNAFISEEFDEEDLGVLEFNNCLQYRLGAPNEDGFYIYNKSRYKKYGVQWGEFYLVQNSDWQINFPEPVFIDNSIKNEKLNHYLFYFRDETFECVSLSYSFKVIKANCPLRA
jgi:hypothetical protein